MDKMTVLFLHIQIYNTVKCVKKSHCTDTHLQTQTHGEQYWWLTQSRPCVVTLGSENCSRVQKRLPGELRWCAWVCERGSLCSGGVFRSHFIFAVINNCSMGRGGGVRGSSTRPKTFGGPFSSNWHRRFVAPQPANSTKDTTLERNRKPLLTLRLLKASRGTQRVENLLHGKRETGRGDRDRGDRRFPFDNLFNVEPWAHLSVSLCPPSPPFLHPSLFTDRGGRCQSAHIFHLDSITWSPHRHSADWTSGGELIFRAHDCVTGQKQRETQ